MEATKHPAYEEEKSRLHETISAINDRKESSRKAIAGMYAPPDSLRVFGNNSAKLISDCNAALRHLYFGRVDWKDEETDQSEVFYIGNGPLHPLIYDWRDNFLGDLYYNHATNRTNGELLLVRKLEIRDSVLMGIEDDFEDVTTSSELASDSMLSRILSESRGTLSEIVATINAQQYRIIRSPVDKYLVIQGVPGSGKTVIALHRVAYLLYNHPELRKQNILILGPNPIFMNYVSGVLPSLGERRIPQKTFDAWAIDQLGEQLIYQSQEDLLEFWLSPEKSASEKVMHLRNCKNMGSLKMGELLRRYVDFLKDEALVDIGTLVCNYVLPVGSARRNIRARVERSQDEILELINGLHATPLNYRRDAVRTKLANDLSREIMQKLGLNGDEREQYRKHIEDAINRDVQSYLGKWRAHNVSVSYRRLFRQAGLLQKLGRDLFSDWDLVLMSIDAPTAQTPFRFSDLAGLLYFKLLLDGTRGDGYGHIVVDEAQDLPALFFEGLRQFTRQKSLTILGDIGQGIFLNNGLAKWDDLLPILPELDSEIEELRICYRSTYEIMAYANSVLGKTGIANDELITPLNRPGKPVQFHPYSDTGEYAKGIIDILRIETNDKHNSVAIICRSASECKRVAELLLEHGFRSFELVDSREAPYHDGIVILPAYLAKGLEFDVAILPDGHMYGTDDLSVRLLFVALTRAAHSLHVSWLGKPSPLLDDKLEKVQITPFLSEKALQPMEILESYATASGLDADWCVELLARLNVLPLLHNGKIDPIVMDMLAKSNKTYRSSFDDDTPASLDGLHEQTLISEVRILEDLQDPDIEAGLALSQTTFGLLKNHLRSRGLIPQGEVEFSTSQQVVLLVGLLRLINDQELNLAAGRWAGMQRLREDVNPNRHVFHQKILQILIDYGIVEQQKLADGREQARVNAPWIMDLLNASLGHTAAGFDADLQKMLPRLPHGFSLVSSCPRNQF